MSETEAERPRGRHNWRSGAFRGVVCCGLRSQFLNTSSKPLSTLNFPLAAGEALFEAQPSLPVQMANITPKAAGKRSPKVWFDDGNVLLRAQDTLFRVYRGILGRESAVFRDMFALPQPANGEEVDEEWGCPVVHAQDDVEEMELFLTAVFVPRCA